MILELLGPYEEEDEEQPQAASTEPSVPFAAAEVISSPAALSPVTHSPETPVSTKPPAPKTSK